MPILQPGCLLARRGEAGEGLLLRGKPRVERNGCVPAAVAYRGKVEGEGAFYLLLKIHRRVKEQRGRMALCALSSHQREVLSLMVLDKLWPLCGSQAEALDCVRRHAIDILVVDDSEVDRCLAGGLLAANHDYRVSYASTGREALTYMRHSVPDVVG